MRFPLSTSKDNKNERFERSTEIYVKFCDSEDFLYPRAKIISLMHTDKYQCTCHMYDKLCFHYICTALISAM